MAEKFGDLATGLSSEGNGALVQAQHRESPLAQEYVSHLRGCPEVKTGRLGSDMAGLYVAEPQGSFADNMPAQAQKLAELIAPVCSQRQPLAGLEIDARLRWALQFGPGAVQQLTEATNSKLAAGPSGVRLSTAYESSASEYVKTKNGPYSQIVDTAMVNVAKATTSIMRGNQVEDTFSSQYIPKEYSRSNNWYTRLMYEGLRQTRG
jgi:hypothetical protein